MFRNFNELVGRIWIFLLLRAPVRCLNDDGDPDYIVRCVQTFRSSQTKISLKRMVKEPTLNFVISTTSEAMSK